MPPYWLGIATRMSQNLVSIESIYSRETSSFKFLTKHLSRSMRSVPFRRASLLNHLVNFHQLPTCTSPPSRTPPSNNTIPTEARLCKGAFGLQKICQIPDGDEGARMHRAQLIFLPCQGPAMEPLRLAQDEGWVVDGRQRGGACRGQMGLLL